MLQMSLALFDNDTENTSTVKSHSLTALDVSPWAKEYLATTLLKLQAEDGGVTAKISKLVSMDGDVDVSQRKGKVITVFDVDIFAESKDKQPVKDLVRSKLVPQLRSEFSKLSSALIAEHGKDIQHAPGSNPSSGFSTPKVHAPTSASKSAAQSSTQTNNGGVVNTVTLNETTEFRTSADQLYETFTDPGRIAAFTRAPPKVFEGAKKGGKFELFDGNVSGEYLELESPKRIVQSWRLKQWPAGHFSKLSIEFDQNDVDHVTLMRVSWTGVPVGQEDVTKRNWEEYYVNSIKRTFGFGTIL
ncbi:hypothetical protein HYQ44_000214 [Verticillium longisporum]|nr:hypothetical protein HYQ44_000214 [Verticillium longisporum]